jgi:FKBP-type peptidyl-prolyl cis-trans isomerase
MRRLAQLSMLMVVGVLAFAACGDDGAGDPGAGASECEEAAVTTDTGLEIEDIECGDGETAEEGDLVTVHYTGTLEDGTKFDSSLDRDEPYPFNLGAGMVIPGWDEGVAGMQVGGTRKLTIPPDLAYGEAGAGPIPPNSTLIFDIELLEVEELPAQ